jgi:methionyl-tRNA formyltransferase
LERLIRAYDPWPGTYARYQGARKKERRLKVFPPVSIGSEGIPAGEVLVDEAGEVRVGCGQGFLELGEVQPEGGRRMRAAEFAVGHWSGGEGRLF